MGTSVPSANPAAKVAVVGLISLVVGLAVGYGMGRVTVSTAATPLMGGGANGSYADGYAAAVKKAHDSHIVPAPATQAVSLTGTVKSVGSDSFVMTVNLAGIDPLGELNLPADRTVTLGADAKIVRQSAKSAEEQQKEMDAFQKSLQGIKPGDKLPTPPSAFNEQAIALSDLKTGDTVFVSSDKDILKSTTFSAASVAIPPAIVTPPLPTPPTPKPAQ